MIRKFLSVPAKAITKRERNKSIMPLLPVSSVMSIFHALPGLALR